MVSVNLLGANTSAFGFVGDELSELVEMPRGARDRVTRSDSSRDWDGRGVTSPAGRADSAPVGAKFSPSKLDSFT
jgi:hypothetical protein